MPRSNQGPGSIGLESTSNPNKFQPRPAPARMVRGSQSWSNRGRLRPAMAAVINTSVARPAVLDWSGAVARPVWPVRSSSSCTSRDPTRARGNRGMVCTTCSIPSLMRGATANSTCCMPRARSTAKPQQPRLVARLWAPSHQGPRLVGAGLAASSPPAAEPIQWNWRARITSTDPSTTELTRPTVAMARPRSRPPVNPKLA